jgi:DNA-binding MarR family transcriptional regulator
MATSRLLTAVVARTLRSVDEAISVPQFRVLVMLRYGAPMNVNTVAAGLGVNSSNASRACDKLVVAGLVARTEDPGDRRHLSLSLTQRGRQVVDALMADRQAILDEIVRRLPEDAQRNLADGLEALLSAAEVVGLGPDSDGTDAIIPWVR